MLRRKTTTENQKKQSLKANPFHEERGKVNDLFNRIEELFMKDRFSPEEFNKFMDFALKRNVKGDSLKEFVAIVMLTGNTSVISSMIDKNFIDLEGEFKVLKDYKGILRSIDKDKMIGEMEKLEKETGAIVNSLKDKKDFFINFIKDSAYFKSIDGKRSAAKLAEFIIPSLNEEEAKPLLYSMALLLFDSSKRVSSTMEKVWKKLFYHGYIRDFEEYIKNLSKDEIKSFLTYVEDKHRSKDVSERRKSLNILEKLLKYHKSKINVSNYLDRLSRDEEIDIKDKANLLKLKYS